MGANEGWAVGKLEDDGRYDVGDGVGVMDAGLGGPLWMGAKGANVCNSKVGTGVVAVDVAVVDGDCCCCCWAMVKNDDGLQWMALTKMTVPMSRSIAWLSDRRHREWDMRDDDMMISCWRVARATTVSKDDNRRLPLLFEMMAWPNILLVGDWGGTCRLYW